MLILALFLILLFLGWFFVVVAAVNILRLATSDQLCGWRISGRAAILAAVLAFGHFLISYVAPGILNF